MRLTGERLSKDREKKLKTETRWLWVPSGTSRDGRKFETLSYTYLSLLLGNQQEVINEEEREEENELNTADGSITWCCQSRITLY